jgi:hypothetical protein
LPSREHGGSELEVELGLLQPLWALYNKDGEKEEPASATTPTSAIVPTTMRALTELFLVAENLAMVCRDVEGI